MAEEGSNDRIPAICGHITNMLRYISSSTAAGVLMAEEISHIRDYVCIMKERFPQTEVEYNIPIELLDLVIPKLVIQPLVENSFKYCDRLNCKINISGCIEGQKWRIAVSDNGIGFSEDKINEIMAKCADSLRNYRLHSLEIEGMGLANIYSRLKIYYGENMIFRIYNNSGEGSTVEIGGLISRDEVRRRLIREG
jgi:sensor histidine kinase YesM